MLPETIGPARFSNPTAQCLDSPDIDWSSEQVEELLRATKLCETCRPIFGPDPYEDDGSLLPHHASHETLQQSVDAGCLICTMLYERWRRYSAQPDTPSLIPWVKRSEGLTFYFTRREESAIFGVGPPDLGHSEPPEADILLYLRIRKCKYFQ